MFRRGDLLDGERRHQVGLDQQYAAMQANFRLDKTDVDRLHVERVAVEAKLARLTSQRDAAQQRWQQLQRVAERRRIHLGLPADGRRS